MTRASVALTACSLMLLAGCGSSSTSSNSSTVTSSSESSGATSTPASTATTTAPASSGPVESGVVAIAYKEIAISPPAVKVKVGTTLKWTNFDSVEHNVTSQSGPQQFASKDFGEKGTFEVKVTKPGLIKYQCTIHPASMNGTIEVVK
jgi:plastocyanin